MASKKILLLAGMVWLFSTTVFGQAGSNYDVKDSSVIATKNMPQHTEFLNGAYNFPAKPRNQWELGLKVGAFSISGDMPAKLPTLGFGAHIRKAFGYIFSMRMEYMYGNAKGLAWTQSENFAKNSAWSRYSAPLRSNSGLMVSSLTNSASTPLEPVFYNYKSNVQDLSLEGIVTFNNIRFHKSKTGFNIYGIFGLGATIYESNINALNASGAKYNFASIPSGTYKTRKDTRDALKSLMDDTYETPAENQGDRRPKVFGKTFKPVGHFGAGAAFKLNNRLSLALENRWTITKDDLLDGQRWQEHARGDAVLSRDYDTYNYTTLGLNITLGSKSVEPLWWVNPLDYAYSEIRNPRLMRIPKPILPDTDGDGVTDQFDLEQSPQGCPVDSHGVSLDTDGDGVPDCKDKELITPTYCQPVNADGVGKCPCPDKSCFPPAIVTAPPSCATKLGALPSVSFAAKTVKVSKDAGSLLASIASRMRNNPECKVVVVGYCSSNKQEQQLSWDRVNAVINHMVEKEGVSADRFIFQYAQEGGDCNTIDLRGASEGEAGPNVVPAPHPNLRKK